MADYDKYYQTENLFGDAYPELIAFFKNHEPKGKIIDIGCGQGRNAIPLARLGYSITGIDNSKVGIDQMNQISKANNLKITGLVGDIFIFDNYTDYDIVLLDSMFHFNKPEKQKETALISKIARDLKKNGLICFCIQDTGSKVKLLKDTLKNTTLDFDTLNESYLIYKYEDKESGHKSESKYCMYIVRKN